MTEELSAKLKRLQEKHPQMAGNTDERSSIVLQWQEIVPDHIRLYRRNCKNTTILVKPMLVYGQCLNCGGAKVLRMSELVAGPFKTPISHKTKTGTFHDGFWWENEIHSFACPVCVDPGSFTRIDHGLSDEEVKLDYSKDYVPYPGTEKIRPLGNNLLQTYKNFGRVHGWITVHGKNGRGKTIWAKNILAEFVRMGVRGKYTLAADFLSEIASTFGNDSVQVEDILNMYADVKVLILDEIERIPNSEWFQTKMVQFLNGRYTKGVEGKKHLTILITNEDPDNFMPQSKHMAGYVSSRMQGGTIVEVSGDDKRRMTGAEYQQYLE